MKYIRFIRLPLQIIVIINQIIFFIETVRLFVHGYVVIWGQTVEQSWEAMLSTLMLVAICEVVSFLEAVLFFVSERCRHSLLYIAAVFFNAILFLTMAYYSYYSEVGTVICIVSYFILFVFRIVNLSSGIAAGIRKS